MRPTTPFYCGGMRCPGLEWTASRTMPHPRTCLAQPERWPSAAAVSMAHEPPSHRDPSVQDRDPDPNGCAHRARIDAIARAVADRPSWATEGMFTAGILAALRAIARRSPEAARLAVLEAEDWALALAAESHG